MVRIVLVGDDDSTTQATAGVIEPVVSATMVDATAMSDAALPDHYTFSPAQPDGTIHPRLAPYGKSQALFFPFLSVSRCKC